MHSSFCCFLTPFALLPALVHAQPATKPADPYRDEPLVFERLDTNVTMHADGTGETTSHVILRVQSEGTARQFSVLSFAYASANEQGRFDFVRVHKADGTTVETPADGSMEMPAEVTRDAPVYSDIKEMHLPVRSLSMGDRLEYQTHTTRTKAEAPNQFWGAEHFAVNAGVVLNQTITLSVPSATYVQVWSPNHPAQPTLRDGNKVWRWTSSQTKPSSRDENGQVKAADLKDPDEDDDDRKLPSVAWTTFHNWAEVGDWYRGLAAPRLEPTAAIKAKADDLTKDAKTPQAQVEALYNYVSTKTRYVGISLGVGRYQPHAAPDVLANQYGDCKDKDTLLESLLRAKGFTTASALIGAGIAPVPAVPTPAVFNHVITTVDLPGGRIWLDSTPEVAPYRVLTPILRDQEALVIPASGSASLQKTPDAPPYPYKETFDAVATLDSKGTLKSHMDMTVRSDNELDYRVLLQRVSPAQWDSSMQYVSGVLGFSGTVSNTDFRQPDPTGPVRLNYDYTREEYSDWKNNRILPLFPMLELATIDKDKAPEHDIQLGAPRTLIAHTEIALPEGDRVELPEAVHLKRDYMTFDKTYRLTNGKLYADRTAVILKDKLPKAQWKEYLAALKELGWDDGESFVILIPASARSDKGLATKADITVKADAPHALNESAVQFLRETTAAEQRGDWDTARKNLKQAFDLDPKTPYLMGMMGYMAMHDRKLDEAEADLKSELRDHPDANSGIVTLLCAVYVEKKQPGNAVSLLKSYSSRKDISVETALVNVQTSTGDYAGALATAQAGLTDFPDNRQVEAQIAEALRQLHRDGEAAAAAKKAMDGSDDPYLINNEVYILAQMKQDLPFAEENSRRSIKLLEERTAAYGVDEANSKAFADSANLAASWDTLGYILLLQGKAAEAEPYFYAAWFNRQDVAVGNHLGQTYEALGRKGEALHMYTLATQTDRAANSKDDYAQAENAIGRLDKAGIKASAEPLSLQDMRTFHVKKPAGAQGGGTVRAQVAGTGVSASSLITGDASLKPLLTSIQQLTLKGAVPPGSQARLLRDAVVYCGSTSKDCDFVFMTSSGIQREGVPE